MKLSNSSFTQPSADNKNSNRTVTMFNGKLQTNSNLIIATTVKAERRKNSPGKLEHKGLKKVGSAIKTVFSAKKPRYVKPEVVTNHAELLQHIRYLMNEYENQPWIRTIGFDKTVFKNKKRSVEERGLINNLLDSWLNHTQSYDVNDRKIFLVNAIVIADEREVAKLNLIERLYMQHFPDDDRKLNLLQEVDARYRIPTELHEESDLGKYLDEAWSKFRALEEQLANNPQLG
jgi:hypothetical protein